MSLADRILEAMTGAKLSPADLARATKKTPGAVTQWLDGTIKSLKADTASKIEAATGYRSSWLVNGKGAKKVSTADVDAATSGFLPIRRVLFKLSAGVTGFTVDYIDNGDGEPLFFRADWFKKRGYDPEKCYAMPVAGASMEPELRAGDVVVVNTDATEPEDGAVFAVNYEGEPVIKRLVRDAGQWWLSSDNPDHRRFPRKVCDEGVVLIGKVVHKQSEHI